MTKNQLFFDCVLWVILSAAAYTTITDLSSPMPNIAAWTIVITGTVQFFYTLMMHVKATPKLPTKEVPLRYHVPALFFEVLLISVFSPLLAALWLLHYAYFIYVIHLHK